MALRKPQPIYVSLPGKQWVQRASFFLMVTAGLTLFVMSKANNPAVEKLKTSLMDTLVPVLTVAASPFDAMDSGIGWLKEMSQLRAENIALKNENLELLKWQAAAKSMTSENESLRALMKVVPSQTHGSYVTARIVSDMSGPYVHSALINSGSGSGVRPNQAVINESGLVGRTLDIGDSSSRVLLLSDINSRVPVVSEKSHEKSILSGNNNELPTLAYLPTNSHVAIGERIVTSGDGGVFPAGIPVGIVVSTDGGVKIQPFVDPSTVNYVSVIDYTF